jgi:hypothetical protein
MRLTIYKIRREGQIQGIKSGRYLLDNPLEFYAIL